MLNIIRFLRHLLIPVFFTTDKTPNSLQKEKERDRELLSLQLVMQQLKLDNENYKKQLTSARESLECNR